jgi:hypothetical protein
MSRVGQACVSRVMSDGRFVRFQAKSRPRANETSVGGPGPWCAQACGRSLVRPGDGAADSLAVRLLAVTPDRTSRVRAVPKHGIDSGAGIGPTLK